MLSDEDDVTIAIPATALPLPEKLDVVSRASDGFKAREQGLATRPPFGSKFQHF